MTTTTPPGGAGICDLELLRRVRKGEARRAGWRPESETEPNI